MQGMSFMYSQTVLSLPLYSVFFFIFISLLRFICVMISEQMHLLAVIPMFPFCESKKKKIFCLYHQLHFDSFFFVKWFVGLTSLLICWSKSLLKFFIWSSFQLAVSVVNAAERVSFFVSIALFPVVRLNLFYQVCFTFNVEHQKKDQQLENKTQKMQAHP